MPCWQPTTNWPRFNSKKNRNITTSCLKSRRPFTQFRFHIRNDPPSLSSQDSRKFRPLSWSSWAWRELLWWNQERIPKITMKLARLYSSRDIHLLENFWITALARNIWRSSQNGWQTPSWWPTTTINVQTQLLHPLAAPLETKKRKK